MAVCVVFDPFIFFYNLFNKPSHESDLDQEFEVSKFTAKGIQMFDETIKEVLNELKKKEKEEPWNKEITNKTGGYQINFVDFNIRL